MFLIPGTMSKELNLTPLIPALTRGRLLLIVLYDITYPFTVNVATVKVGRQRHLKHTFFFKQIFFIPENVL